MIHKDRLWLYGACSVLFLTAPLMAQENLPITFQTTCQTTPYIFNGVGEITESYNHENYAMTVFHCTNPDGSGGYTEGYADSTISCLSAGSEMTVAMILLDANWETDPEFGDIDDWGAVYRIQDGGFQVGTTDACPAGTPVMLNATWGGFAPFDQKTGSITFMRGDQPFYTWEAPFPALEFPVIAGEFISLNMFSHFSTETNFGDGTTTGVFTLWCPNEAIPEPATALLLLAGIPMLRRR